MNSEQLAQKLADKFNPAYIRRDRKKLPFEELRKLPWEERYVETEVRAGPDSSTMVVFRAEDGYPAIRSLTYREVVEAVLAFQEEESNAENKQVV